MTYRIWLKRSVNRLASALDRHPVFSFSLFVGVFIPACLGASSYRLLSHDELFTLYIAQARSIQQLLRDLRTVDLNPPLSYLLTRVSLLSLQSNTLSCRLPEIGAFACTCFFLFRFVWRRAGVVFGLCSISLLLASLAGELATDARPYALLLAFTTLGLLAWQRIAENEGDHAVSSFLLFIAASGLLTSHLFGVFSWLALATGAGVHQLQQRRMAWLPALAFTTPLLAASLYLPLLRNHSTSAFPLAFQPSGEQVFDFYIHHIDREIVVILLTALLTAIVFGRKSLAGRGTWLFTIPEWVTVIVLLAVPGLLMGMLMLSHGAFFPRYGVVASLAVSLLATAFLAFWTDRSPSAALLASAIALLISGQLATAVHGARLLLHPIRASEPVVHPCEACLLSTTINPDIPFVDASGLTFLEMDHRENAQFLDRVFFLSDPQAALQYAHATIFNGLEEESRVFPIRAHVQEASAFFRSHPCFFVFGQYDYPEDWLLRKLLADGANLRLVASVASDYKDHEFYLVTMPHQSCHAHP